MGVLIEGGFPIVQIDYALCRRLRFRLPAVVVVEINEQGALMFDPARGEIVQTQDESTMKCGNFGEGLQSDKVALAYSAIPFPRMGISLWVNP